MSGWDILLSGEKKVDRKWWEKLESGGRKNTLYEQKINSGKKKRNDEVYKNDDLIKTRATAAN